MNALDRLVWAGTATFEIGEFHVGVRCNDTSFAHVLFDVLAAHRVEGVDAPPNYSVKIADDDRRGFHLLYRSSALAVRTRDPRRLVAAVCRYLASHAPYDPELFVLAGVVVVGRHGAVIAPSGLRQMLPTVERRLDARGLRVVDAPWVLLDPAARAVVVPEHGLAVDDRALEMLPLPAREEPPVAPGRYPVVGWALSGDVPLTRAQAVAQATRAVVDGRAPQAVLDGLAHVMCHIRPVALRLGEPAAVAAALGALMQQ